MWLHCHDCHHEFHGHDGDRCDWCGGTSYVLEHETPLLKLIRSRRLQGHAHLVAFLEPSTVTAAADRVP